MKTHKAACHCGKLEVICRSEPTFVAICHCEDCQRRTGSPYHTGSWFKKDTTEIHGESSVYTLLEHDGVEMSYHFCPNCGSNVFWETPAMTGALGVAVGCFADPQFPKPTVSFYDNQRYDWVTVPEGLNTFSEGGQSKK
jgi:hypothetical protein